ncbi:DUF222 domain-containing protein [Egibacter rhizosphaerae]|nr:DUF222 domain-containing protein [Egibacter rhizosphaerae]
MSSAVLASEAAPPFDAHARGVGHDAPAGDARARATGDARDDTEDRDAAPSPLGRIRAAIAELARDPLSGAISDAELLASVEELVQLERQLAAERLRRVAEIDHRSAYLAGGAGSTVRWLADRLGRTRPEALKEVRTALGLQELPETRALLAAGDCSEGHATVAVEAWRELRNQPTPADGDQGSGAGTAGQGGDGGTRPHTAGDDDDHDGAGERGGGDQGGGGDGRGDGGTAGDDGRSDDRTAGDDGASTQEHGASDSGEHDAGAADPAGHNGQSEQPDDEQDREHERERARAELDRLAGENAANGDRAELRRRLEQWRQQLDPDRLGDRDRRAFANRELWISQRPDADGTYRFGGRADPHGVAQLRTVLDALARPATAGSTDPAVQNAQHEEQGAGGSPGDEQGQPDQHGEATRDGRASQGSRGSTRDGRESRDSRGSTRDGRGPQHRGGGPRRGDPDDRGHATGGGRSRNQRQYDALIALARRTIEAGGLPDLLHASTRVLLLTSPEALHGHPDAQPSRLDGAGEISSETAQLICCDAEFAAVTTRNGEVLDAGRTRRQPTGRQRDAVIARDQACIGCGARLALCQLHHVAWWYRDRGPTNVDNLVVVCFECHWHIHHHGWEVSRRPGGTYTLARPARPPTGDRSAGGAGPGVSRR